MFSHVAAATLGLSPNAFTLLGLANQGLFYTEVIIEPVVPSYGGGGYVGAPIGTRATHYRVTVRVTFNGKVYTDTKILDELNAKVFAQLRGIKFFKTDEIMVAVNGIQITEQADIKIIVRRK